jgi:arginyl-tRNA synthetase
MLFRSLLYICIKGQTEILKKLNINYDYFDYESDYIFGNRLNDIIEDLRDTQNLFEDDEGRYVLNFENENLSYLVLTRADKTSLYPLRDIAYTIDKSKGNYNRNVIILGEDQKTYFQQIKQTVSLLGYQAPEFVHYSFVLLTDGKMSTRNGKVVLLEDFMKEAIIKANYEINKRERTTDESTIESIAYGALKYAILKVSNDKNVTFDWETALNFEGESAPYIQYSYARICSIFKNYGKELPSHIDFSLLDTNEEFELAKEISNFPDIINRTASELSMHILANYLFELTKKFSKFYHEHSVLNAETNELKESRLILIYTVKIVLENGLKILGINPIEEM